MAINFDDIKGICKREIDRAGARYTPHVEEGAPNLQVEKVLDAIDALSFDERANNKLKALSDELKEIWKDAPNIVKSIFKNRKQTPQYIAEVLDSLIECYPGYISNELGKLTRSVNFVVQELQEKRRELLQYERSSSGSDEERSTQYDRIQIEDVLDVVRRVESYNNTAIPNLFNVNRALLIGEWGTGKTHTLADVTQNRIEDIKPTLFVLAHHLSHNGDPISQICKDFNLDCSKGELLDFLQSAGEELDQRALLIVDGINEGDREVWADTIKDIANEIADYSHIGLILSCRTPYDEYLFTVEEKNLFDIIKHPGFVENEIDAQQKFFKYYDIPTPQVPLLNPEFSRPLFLKLFCNAVENRAQGTKRRKIRELANGQKGMTYLFEYFTKNAGESVEDEFGLPGKTCWKVIKGMHSGDAGLKGLAETMAEENRRYVTHHEAIDIVLNLTSLNSQDAAEKFIQEMAAEGLLLEDLIYNDGEYIEVIRLPYQRFSDHVIARHLLYTGGYLNKETKETIKRSFYKDRPLGKIFLADRYGNSFSDPGLASALMLEFPEAVKNALPKNERELIAYLPKKRRFFKPVAESFLDGLIWRSTDAFGAQTGRMVQILLNESDEFLLREVFEVLVTLASRSQHPCNASWLFDYLKRQTIQKRDLQWSEYLRRVNDESTIVRLVAWVEEINIDKLDNGTVSNLITLLSLMLTTTHRKRRDRVTRALYLLGYIHPKELFSHTIQSFRFNDPYVPERLLAVSYGIAMNSWADQSQEKFHKNIGAFAKELYEAFLAPEAKHASHHTLMKDYASGIVKLARKVDQYCIANQYVKYTRPPFSHFPVSFPEADSIQDDEVEDAENAIHMDFGNYTIGRLIEGRGNYNYKHPEYQKVKRQIKWRILDLGYDSAVFNEVDRQLNRRNFSSGRSSNGGKIDRYGKKYSWIAYFEMYGLREDRGLLPEDRMEHRSSDTDIDPSFPIQENSWKPKLPEIFKSTPDDPAEWLDCDFVPDYQSVHLVKEIDSLDGPWVLLDGFIEQRANDDRSIFTFLRGLLVDLDKVDKLESAMQDVQYLGNHKIPEPHGDYYTFCGETPWSCKFGRFLRNSNCKAKRDIREVFSRREIEKITKHVDELDEGEMLDLRTRQQFQKMPWLDKENKDLVDDDGMVILTKSRDIPGINAEIPIHEFKWESYHSKMNQVDNIDFPAPAICEHLNLKKMGRKTDLFDENNNKAFLYRKKGKRGTKFNLHLSYLRQDLLEEYLLQTNQTLVWIDWGERNLHYELLNTLGDHSKEQKIIHNYGNLHRRYIKFDDIK